MWCDCVTGWIHSSSASCLFQSWGPVRDSFPPPPLRMLFFSSVRLLLNAVLFHAGFVYAFFISLRQSSTPASAAQSRGKSPYRQLPLGTLKLWLMLSVLNSVSFLIGDTVPLFPEMRNIFVFVILFAPPDTQSDTYDRVFAPFLQKTGSLLYSVHQHEFFSRRVALSAARLLVAAAIAVMNYVDLCGVLRPEAIKDILGGLVFARRGLRDAAADSSTKSRSDRTVEETPNVSGAEGKERGRTSIWTRISQVLVDATGAVPPADGAAHTLRRRVARAPVFSATEERGITSAPKSLRV